MFNKKTLKDWRDDFRQTSKRIFVVLLTGLVM